MIRGSGGIVIVTGWTIAKTIAAQLDPTDYAAIGQLFSSARGINLLVRNLLANPQIRHLVLLSATPQDANAGGCDRILDFFQYGVRKGKSDTGQECWVIDPSHNSFSKAPGLIDIEIPLYALDGLRRSVECLYYRDRPSFLAQIKALAQDLSPDHWHLDPQIFPMREHLPTITPRPRYGHRIEGSTIAETWVKVIHRIKTTGTIRPTGYDDHWQELIDLVAIVKDEPPGFYFPEPNYLPCDRPFIESYVSQILDDATESEGVKYTYGQRLRSWFGRDQVQQVIAKLIGEIDAASAVMSLWDAKDHETGGSPCLNHIWVRVVDGELSMTATFRSNDMFSAWPANAMGLRALQQHILEGVSAGVSQPLSLGPLITISQSAHIYSDCWENADSLIANHYGKKPIYYDDASGNFIVEVEGSAIVVTQTTEQGAAVRSWSGTHPLFLLRRITADVPAIEPTHAGYLGIELQRAHTLGSGYIQDRG